MFSTSYDPSSIDSDQNMQHPLSVHSDQSSSSSGITWLLNVMDSPYTLPPLDTLIRSNVFRRGIQAVSETDHSAVGKSAELESLQRWTRELESVLPSTKKKQKNMDSITMPTSEKISSRNLPAVISPYISHRNGASVLCAPESTTKQRDIEKKEDIIGAFAEYLRSSQLSSIGHRNQKEETRRHLSIAIAAHISKEAASKSKMKMSRITISQRKKWSSAKVSQKGTFDAMAREEANEELSRRIFSGIFTSSENMPETKGEVFLGPTQQNKSLLDNQTPPSNHDPLYRIMREESEIAMLRQNSVSQHVVNSLPRSGNIDSLKCQNHNQSSESKFIKCAKAAAVYDRDARILLREHVVISAFMIRGPDLTLLRSFGTISPDMWVTLRAVYFLFVSYYELIVMCDASSSVAASVTDSRTIQRGSKGSENQESLTHLNDEQFFISACQSLNIGILWELIGAQCREYNMTSATVVEKFSWHMMQTLLAFPDEFSCALVYIERGEDKFDDNMMSILAGGRNSVDFWRNSRFYQAFPEDHLTYLRSVVSPTMFTPLTTAMKSVACSRLCAWARRISAGLYAAKSFSIRNISKCLDHEGSRVADLTFYGNSPNKPYGSFDNSIDNGSYGDVSVDDASVFNRSNLSLNSPKKRVEQFINYPGTSLGPGLIHKGSTSMQPFSSEKLKAKKRLSIVAYVPISINDDSSTTTPSLFDEHICIFNAAMLLARPSDRLDILLLNTNEKEDDPHYKSHDIIDNNFRYEDSVDTNSYNDDRDIRVQFDDGNGKNINVYDNYSMQMANIFARNYYENKMFSMSRSPLHRVILESEFSSQEEILETPNKDISVSFNNIKGVSQKTASAPSRYNYQINFTGDQRDDSKASRTHFCPDLLVVDVNGRPFSNAKERDIHNQNSAYSLALVFARHWALVLENTFPISRFVVFITQSRASHSAFMVSLFLGL